MLRWLYIWHNVSTLKLTTFSSDVNIQKMWCILNLFKRNGGSRKMWRYLKCINENKSIPFSSDDKEMTPICCWNLRGICSLKPVIETWIPADVCVCIILREREGEREERERERRERREERERQTDIQADRQTYRRTDRQTDREWDYIVWARVHAFPLFWGVAVVSLPICLYVKCLTTVKIQSYNPTQNCLAMHLLAMLPEKMSV